MEQIKPENKRLNDKEYCQLIARHLNAIDEMDDNYEITILPDQFTITYKGRRHALRDAVMYELNKWTVPHRRVENMRDLSHALVVTVFREKPE